MVNVADASLAKGSSDFLPYLESQGRFATMIKSASYLMHKEGIAEPTHFENIRSLILDHSDFVVQDDSGVPLRLLRARHVAARSFTAGTRRPRLSSASTCRRT